ncbi:MAG: hypothetical protein IJJ40_07250 [Clostridia bacterium]|nr:hypothetical protein [Clostridia bacterium]
MMKKLFLIFLLVVLPFSFLVSCKEKENIKTDSFPAAVNIEENNKKLHLFINGEEYDVAWEDNASVGALISLAEKNEITVKGNLYGNFEQVGAIGQNLPSSDRRLTTNSGDIMLYSGDKIVVFYGSNTWEYTPLGKIRSKTEAELTALLSADSVTIKISYY